MGEECNYSFSNLFFAAYDRYQTSVEMSDFLKLNQDGKNNKVKEWAQKAGWQTVERIGSDGKMYLAFAPKFN